MQAGPALEQDGCAPEIFESQHRSMDSRPTLSLMPPPPQNFQRKPKETSRASSGQSLELPATDIAQTLAPEAGYDDYDYILLRLMEPLDWEILAKPDHGDCSLREVYRKN